MNGIVKMTAYDNSRRLRVLGWLLASGAIELMFAPSVAANPNAAIDQSRSSAESMTPNRSISADNAWLTETTSNPELDSKETDVSSESQSRQIPRKAGPLIPPVGDARIQTDKTSMLAIIWPLAIVLVLLAATVVIARRWIAGTSIKKNQGLRILQRTHLTQKQWLAVVECGSKALLIAVNPDRIDMLYCIDDAEDLTRIASNRKSNQESVRNNPFAFQLEREAGRLTREEILTSDSNTRQQGQDTIANDQLQTLMGRLSALRKAHESSGKS
jgi:flagellar biogenesis protein FliO